MVNYSNSRVYKIVCNITGEIYIGSTTKTLSQRLAKHRQNFKMFLDGKCNNTRSFQIIEKGDYNIILIEEINCENKEQLLQAERRHIEGNECVNKNIPTRTNKEWMLDNQEKLKKYRKNYRIENQDKIQEYFLENKEIAREYRQENKIKLQQYFKDNREKINKRRRELYNLKKQKTENV